MIVNLSYFDKWQIDEVPDPLRGWQKELSTITIQTSCLPSTCINFLKYTGFSNNHIWINIIDNFSIAAVCWSVHYAKRLLETLFIHRFSHGTMPLRNLFRNCAYYWLFTLYIAYHINHPLYTAPCSTCLYLGLAGFTVSILIFFKLLVVLTRYFVSYYAKVNENKKNYEFLVSPSF